MYPKQKMGTYIFLYFFAKKFCIYKNFYYICNVKVNNKSNNIKNFKSMNTYAKFCANVFVAKCEEEYEKGDIIEVTTKYGKENECEVHNLICQKNGFYYYSITRVDGFDAKERLRRKAEKYSQAAINAEARSEAYVSKSNEATKGIVFGQPILVGHHSESKHRNALEKSHRAMDNAVSEMKKAEEYSDKAESYKFRAEHTMNLSMPESLEYYTEELEKAKEYHEGLKSGKYEREHGYSLTYAKKNVNELTKKVELAKRLWG